jgi:hypothetical protein
MSSTVRKSLQAQDNEAADAAYTHVLVTGDDGIDPVYLEVSHFPFWALGGHKTAHIKAPTGLTAAQLVEYATAVASELQYVGMSESFSSPIRPQLLVGDVASVYYTGDTESTSLGVITDITHSFGETGFFTDFTVDSGGVATDGENYTVISRSAVLAGYNGSSGSSTLLRWWRTRASGQDKSNIEEDKQMKTWQVIQAAFAALGGWLGWFFGGLDAFFTR